MSQCFCHHAGILSTVSPWLIMSSSTINVCEPLTKLSRNMQSFLKAFSFYWYKLKVFMKQQMS